MHNRKKINNQLEFLYKDTILKFDNNYFKSNDVRSTNRLSFLEIKSISSALCGKKSE